MYGSRNKKTIAYLLITFKFTVRSYFRFLSATSQLVIALWVDYFKLRLFFRLTAFGLSFVTIGWLRPCSIRIMLMFLQFWFWYFHAVVFDGFQVMSFRWMSVNRLGNAWVKWCRIGSYRPATMSCWFDIVVWGWFVVVFGTWKTGMNILDPCQDFWQFPYLPEI